MRMINMGHALAHWLGFQEKIGRSFMMDEYALKYPVCDYLVNEGNIDIQSIKLQHPHPNFSNKRVDLAIIGPTITPLIHLFEFKLAKSSTRKPDERQRIFDDIMRLHLARAATTNKCYFIIAGKTIHFQRDFKNFKYPQSHINGFYAKWFAFGNGRSLTFDVASETNSIYSSIYADFKTNYQNIQLPNTITTKCEFITADRKQYVPYMAGIWSIT